MRKFKKLLIILLSFLISVSWGSISASAVQGTTYTYTISNNSSWIRTQEAYVPSQVCLRDAELYQPTDIFIHGELIYVADAGNGRVVIYNRNTKKYTHIENDNFVSPTGITDKNGKLLNTILKPENSPLMSKDSIFKPLNVVVSEEGNIFVVGEGSYDGLMQFSPEGEFQGYFAANKRNLTMLERIQEMMFTREQKEQLLTRKPRAIQNIDISSRDLIYSVTQSAEITSTWSASETKTENTLKMHKHSFNL